MLGPMDWIVIAFVGLMAVALALALGYGLDRERQLEAARAAAARAGTAGDAAGDGSPDWPDATPPDVATLVRRLRDRLDAS